jgi:hypothetical protein
MSPVTSGRREMSWRCRQRCRDERLRCGIVACNEYRQSSSGNSVCLRKATMIASSSPVRTVDFGSFGPVGKSLTLSRLRHFATVLGLIPNSRLSCASLQSRPRTDGGRAFDLRSLYCCSHGVRGRGAPVTNLSHSASLHAGENNAPSNCGIKQLGGAPTHVFVADGGGEAGIGVLLRFGFAAFGQQVAERKTGADGGRQNGGVRL